MYLLKSYSPFRRDCGRFQKRGEQDGGSCGKGEKESSWLPSSFGFIEEEEGTGSAPINGFLPKWFLLRYDVSSEI